MLQAGRTLVRMQVPIMLRSKFCMLYDMDEKEVTALGECPYDQVRLAGPLAAWLQHVSDVPRRSSLQTSPWLWSACLSSTRFC